MHCAQALSSTEAEFYGGVSGASDSILLKHALEFIGLLVNVELQLDSSGARGVLARKGAGATRYFGGQDALWVQNLVEKNILSVKCVKGIGNPADIGTKILDG